MCHGHPRRHPCSHTSINWHYCPAAVIDLSTGVETPCRHLTYASSQPTASDCPLQNCQYKAMGGSWTCCQCNHGPNESGWCENFIQLPPDEPTHFDDAHLEQCAHGCCERCTRSGKTTASPFRGPSDVEKARPSMSDMTFAEPQKGTASRKFGYQANLRLPHRRSSGFSLLSSISSAAEEEIATFAPTSGSPSSSFRKHRSSNTTGKTHRGRKHKVEAY